MDYILGVKVNFKSWILAIEDQTLFHLFYFTSHYNLVLPLTGSPNTTQTYL